MRSMVFGRSVCSPVALLSAAGLCAAAVAQPSFSGVGFIGGEPYSIAYGVSGNGATVAGSSQFGNGLDLQGFYSSGSISGIGFLQAANAVSECRAISGDGVFVAGFSRYNPLGGATGLRFRPIRFNTTTFVMEPIPFLTTTPNGTIGRGKAINTDGSVIVGDMNTGSGGTNNAFRWSAATNASVTLGVLPGDTLSTANGVSGDGTVIVGTSSVGGFPPPTPIRAFRWQGGAMAALPTLVPVTAAEALGISRDGATIVGYAVVPVSPTRPAGSTEIVAWTNGGATVTALGALDNGGSATVGIGRAVSSNGARIVGESVTNTPVAGSQAVVWDQSGGVRTVAGALVAAGLDPALLSGWTLTSASGVSDDGTVIVGTGIDPNGDDQAWRAVLPLGGGGPAPCNPADIAATDGTQGADGCVNNGDFQLFFQSFFNALCTGAIPCNAADIAATDGTPGADGSVDNGDFQLFFQSFFNAVCADCL